MSTPPHITDTAVLKQTPDDYGRRIVHFYFFSGVVGLAYQVLWARMLSLQFGVSIFGVVITAAAFMVGLGLGSFLGGPLSRLNARPLRFFAMLEGGVALYALLLPLLLSLLDGGVAAVAPGSLAGWYSLQFCAALLLIALPATALGIGFPMVLRSLESQQVSLGRVYGMNTLGGALGALLPLWLLPVIGWSNSVLVVASLGAAVTLFAWRLSVVMPALAVSRVAANPVSNIPLSTIVAYAIVGASALMLEIAWTRLFGMLLLRTEYVMAVILATFLLGIGGGSLLAQYMRARYWLELLPLLSALFALLSLWAIPLLAAWVERAHFGSLFSAMLIQGGAVALLTLPVTLLLGAWLPLLNLRLGGVKSNGAWLYGANSIGAALGALLAGFVLIPWLGTTGALVLAALMLFMAGMVWARPRLWLLLPVLVVIAWPVYELQPVSQLLPETQKGSHDLMVHEDALSITHVVATRDGQRLLLADLQRMDASSEPLAVVSQQNQVRLPLLLHPSPKTVLFLGLGTGISAAASAPWTTSQRTAVELSQGSILAAGDYFVPVNGGVTAQMRVVRDDARRYLRTSQQNYDVIIGDLFHPDLVGRSSLLSLQQFERARASLTEKGIFVQWLALNQFDPHSLQVVMRTFQQAFPDAVIFVDGFRLALVGGNGWQPTVQAMQHNLQQLTPEQQQQATGGEGEWSWLGRYWGGIHIPAGAIQDEWSPVIEFSLPRARYRGDMDLVKLLEWLLQQRPHVTQAQQALAVNAESVELFERGYVATELSIRSWIATLKGDEQQGQKLLRLAYQANPQDRWVTGAIADRMYASVEQLASQEVEKRQVLETIIAIRPDHVDALRELWRLAVAEGNVDQTEFYRQRLEEISPLDMLSQR